MPETLPYLNDSLRWIAAEVRYPVLDALSVSVPEGLRDYLLESFPVRQDENQLSISVGSSGPIAQQTNQHRFSRRDRLASIVVGRDGLKFETTNYPGWSEFRTTLIDVLASLVEFAHPSGIARVGLRYIDEIRVPSPIENFSDWGEWIDSRLVGPFLVKHDPPLNSGTVLLQYGAAPGFVTILRAGPVASGRAVQDNGPLLMPVETPDGAYFLMDTDASWAEPSGQVPEFTVEAIANVADQLHSSCKQLYEESIQQKLRDEVLNQPRPNDQDEDDS
jgi:uncharacterized protein (TIGR04255 family)